LTKRDRVSIALAIGSSPFGRVRALAVLPTPSRPVSTLRYFRLSSGAPSPPRLPRAVHRAASIRQPSSTRPRAPSGCALSSDLENVGTPFASPAARKCRQPEYETRHPKRSRRGAGGATHGPATRRLQLQDSFILGAYRHDHPHRP